MKKEKEALEPRVPTRNREPLFCGRTFWDKQKPDFRWPSLQGEESAQVVVIGGGMSGVLCAYQLAKAGLDTVLIEQHRLASGSTVANTGLLQYSSDKPLHAYTKDVGSEAAVEFYRQGQRAIEEIDRISAEISGQAGSKIHFRRCPSLYLASFPEHLSRLEEEYRALTEHGFPCMYLNRKQLHQEYALQAPGALLTYQDASIDPVAFVQETAQLAKRRYGLRIYEQTAAKFMETGWVHTAQGKLRCQSVVLASGYAKSALSEALGPMRRCVVSYALASEPLPESALWKGDAMIWETARPYLYMRKAPGGRIIVGGLDEEAFHLPGSDLLAHKTQLLLESVRRFKPGLTLDASYQWAAWFGESQDAFPYIGPDPLQRGLYSLLGYGGNGTVYAAAGSKAICDHLQGKENPLLALTPLRAVRKGAMEA